MADAAPPGDASILPHPAFPDSDEEAARRFALTRHQDPFPEIPPALLNTADLLDYIAATGMIYPFDINWADYTEMLKPASCGIRLGGEVVFWETQKDGSPKKIMQELARGEELKLKQNSIVYVTLEPVLRLPDYIAARFNLTIRDIYRGILVGTGPLVDPGFEDRLHLPLHNLTINDYSIRGGEPLVWMEFTKLSPNSSWAGGDAQIREGEYVGFPERKRERRTVEHYLKYASDEPITSSIPPLLGKAAESARRAERSATRIFGISLLAAIAVVIGIATIVISVYGLVESSDEANRTASAERLKPRVGAGSRPATSSPNTPVRTQTSAHPEALRPRFSANDRGRE
jgi:deoxycytidine triphosphate deaminase